MGDVRLPVSTKSKKQKNWFAVAVLPDEDLSSVVNKDKFSMMVTNGCGELLSFEIDRVPTKHKPRITPKQFTTTKKGYSHVSVVFNIAVEPKNSIAVSVSLDRQVIVWDLKEKLAKFCMPTISHGIYYLSFNPIDSSMIATAAGDGLRLFQVSKNLDILCSSNICLPIKTRVTALSWHPSKEGHLAIGTGCGQIIVYDIRNNQQIVRFSSTDHPVNNMVYSLVWGPFPQSLEQLVIYAVYQDGNLIICDLSTKSTHNFCNFFSVNETLKKFSEVAWRSENHIAVGCLDGTVLIFSSTGEKLLTIGASNKLVQCIRWHPDIEDREYKWLLAVSSNEENIQIFDITINMESPNPDDLVSPTRSLVGHKGRVTSMSWSPHSNNLLASVSYDKTCQVWNALTGEPIANFRGHRSCLFTIEWHPIDCDLIVSGGEDNILQFWRPSKQKHLLPQLIDSKIKIQETFTETDHKGESIPISFINEHNYIKGKTFNNTEVSVDKNIDLPNSNAQNKDLLDMNEVESKINECKAEKPKKTIPKSSVKRSLFPLTNKIENSSLKTERQEDIENMIKKSYGEILSEKVNNRLLSYGDAEDASKLMLLEQEHHKSQGFLQYYHILNVFSGNTASLVKEAIKSKELSPDLIAYAASVSRQLWIEACRAYSEQLVATGNFVLAASYLVSISCVSEAITLLFENQLYREAIILAKTNYISTDQLNEMISTWTEKELNKGNFETAVKSLISIGKHSEAALILARKNDTSSLFHAVLLFHKSEKLSQLKIVWGKCYRQLLIERNSEQLKSLILYWPKESDRTMFENFLKFYFKVYHLFEAQEQNNFLNDKIQYDEDDFKLLEEILSATSQEFTCRKTQILRVAYDLFKFVAYNENDNDNLLKLIHDLNSIYLLELDNKIFSSFIEFLFPFTINAFSTLNVLERIQFLFEKPEFTISTENMALYRGFCAIHYAEKLIQLFDSEEKKEDCSKIDSSEVICIRTELVPLADKFQNGKLSELISKLDKFMFKN